MKNNILIFCFFALQLGLKAQPFNVGHVQQTFIDPTRSNREIPCEIYYPSLQDGDDVLIADGEFPVLAFGHGFFMAWSAYDIYWMTLVPEGYIMVFPTTEGSLAPSHADFGKDLAFLCQAMQSEGADDSSPFFEAVAQTCAVMGHSMGGGSAFLAMEEDPNITALATVAAAETNPSSVDAAGSVTKPSLVFSGANDCVTPPEDHQIPMYDALESSCKTFLSVTGADHCQFASESVPCSLGQSFCSPQASISAEEQQSVVFTCLIPWLNYYLKNDCAAGDLFQGLLVSPGGFTSEQNCTLDCLTNNIDMQSNETVYKLYPNPCDHVLIFEAPEREFGQTYCIENMLGQVIFSSFIQSPRIETDLQSQPDGLYFFKLGNGRTSRFIIQR